jgi:hypothetical protein
LRNSADSADSAAVPLAQQVPSSADSAAGSNWLGPIAKIGPRLWKKRTMKIPLVFLGVTLYFLKKRSKIKKLAGLNCLFLWLSFVAMFCSYVL